LAMAADEAIAAGSARQRKRILRAI